MRYVRIGDRLSARVTNRWKTAMLPMLVLVAACGTGGDGDQATNTPLSTPMALVINQDDTTMTTVRLDGKASPLINTLSLGPVQSDAIGGVAFSLGEWIFVTNRATHRVATIDPIAATTPILEEFLSENPQNPLIKIGQRPARIYRDPVDKEVLWTMNDGDMVTGLDTVANCPRGGSVSVLHNSHLGVGGEKPRVTSIVCLSGKGEHLAAFSRPPATAQELAFVSSKTTGIISVLLPVPIAGGAIAWSEFSNKFNLCNKQFTSSIPLNCGAAPTALFWSNATKRIYSYLSGERAIVEIDPVNLAITKTIDVAPPANTTVLHVGMTPNGRFLILTGEDVGSDSGTVLGKIGVVDLSVAVPRLVTFAIPQLEGIRPTTFLLPPDGKRLYLLQSNETSGLAFPAQAHTLKKDRLLIFDPSMLPAAPTFVTEITNLPPSDAHGMDIWVTGPPGVGSAKAIVVTNATSGRLGSVVIIDAATNAIVSTIPVGNNPKQVTVYYAGLAAGDNQATPIW